MASRISSGQQLQLIYDDKTVRVYPIGHVFTYLGLVDQQKYCGVWDDWIRAKESVSVKAYPSGDILRFENREQAAVKMANSDDITGWVFDA